MKQGPNARKQNCGRKRKRKKEGQSFVLVSESRKERLPNTKRHTGRKLVVGSLPVFNRGLLASKQVRLRYNVGPEHSKGHGQGRDGKQSDGERKNETDKKAQAPLLPARPERGHPHNEVRGAARVANAKGKAGRDSREDAGTAGED